MSSEKMRRFVPPLGWPFKFRAVTTTPANRLPRFVVLNRYPRQVIGFAVRLPDDQPLDVNKVNGNHRALSIMWANPARWWK